MMNTATDVNFYELGLRIIRFYLNVLCIED